MRDIDSTKLTATELERICMPEECQRLSGIAWITLRRNYPQYIIRLSERRSGMRLKNVLRLEKPK